MKYKNPISNTKSADKIQVVTSFYPLYFFAEEIGGDKAVVINITPAAAEPHDYEPTTQDIARIENSKILVLNGGVEPWGDSIKKNLDPSKTIIVTASEGIETQQVIEDGQSVTDPHVWLSPILAKQMVDKIEQAYTKADPANAAYYQANASALKTKLDDLDAEYRAGLAQCTKKDIITSHAAFGYLASTYHLNQVPIGGLSPDAEPSPTQIAHIADFAKKNNVKYIFFESLVSPKLSQTIAQEVGAQTMVLDPIESITPEALAAGQNYLTVMRNNLANLKIALQCQ
jgi:zinc transport system substrate-binding protein